MAAAVGGAPVVLARSITPQDFAKLVAEAEAAAAEAERREDAIESGVESGAGRSGTPALGACVGASGVGGRSDVSGGGVVGMRGGRGKEVTWAGMAPVKVRYTRPLRIDTQCPSSLFHPFTPLPSPLSFTHTPLPHLSPSPPNTHLSHLSPSTPSTPTPPPPLSLTHTGQIGDASVRPAAPGRGRPVPRRPSRPSPCRPCRLSAGLVAWAWDRGGCGGRGGG